ncbi:Uncharacterized protein Rs2_19330 [Raphanus sativus]|nr:Uncharacterized protein Rs2_19330 [Raphanus sativus]
MQRPNILPLPRQHLNNPLQRLHHILHNLHSFHRQLPNLHNATRPRPNEKHRRSTNLLHLLLPVPMLQIHSRRNLLCLKKLLPDQPRQERDHSPIRQEHLVRIAELPLRLERLVIGFELRELEDLRDRDVIGFDLLPRVFFG